MEQKQRTAVEDYLAQKMGVAREQAKQLPATFIEGVIADPRAGLAALFTHLQRKVPGRVEGHAQALSAKLQKASAEIAKRLTGTGALADTMTDEEIAVNKEKFAAALEEAKTLGLVTTDEGGDLESEQVGYLLPSGHYGASGLPDASIRQGQYQLFAFLHLLKKHGATNPLYPEGLAAGAILTNISPVDIGPFRQADIRDPAVQEYCFSHPDEYTNLLDQLSLQGRHEGFYTTTAYANIRGIHQPDVYQKMVSVSERTGLEQQFPAKYVGPMGIQPVPEWHGDRWKVRINGGLRLIDPEEIVRDCDAFIKYAEDMKAMDALREKEVAVRLKKDARTVAMAWIGLAHEDDVLVHAKQQNVKVISVIPTAEVPARLRKEKADLAERNLPAVRQLLAWALVHVRA